MFKVPYFLEGISNIFKPVLTNKEKFENAKGAENYRGKLILMKMHVLAVEFVLEYVLGKR